MLSEKDFIQMSLELNLFFARIMKEHMIFMEIGLPIKNSNLILEADQLKKSFEEFLMEVVTLADGVISQEAIESNEFVTPYTLTTESLTQNLSGVCINQEITMRQMELKPGPCTNISPSLEGDVFDLNNRAINLLVEIISFMENVLSQVLECKLFIAIYPEMLEHLIREAKFYLKLLLDLQERRKTKKDILKIEVFWNGIMGEHAKFIRGMLDPTEEDLIKKAHEFAKLFEKLVKETEQATKEEIIKITKKNLEATKEIKNFKAESTEGLIDCKIKSIINPLLSDHVLRESNHYLRVLKAYLKECKA